jgi:hypothetical protein
VVGTVVECSASWSESSLTVPPRAPKPTPALWQCIYLAYSDSRYAVFLFSILDKKYILCIIYNVLPLVADSLKPTLGDIHMAKQGKGNSGKGGSSIVSLDFQIQKYF